MTKILITLALLAAASLPAHEIGTTRVSVRFPSSGAYEIEVVTDAGALAEKLGIPARQDSLANAGHRFRERVRIEFDGVAVTPEFASAIEPAADDGVAAATIRLTGAIPPGASNFSWTYGWTFASYALSIHGDSSANAATEWLEGGQASAPFALAAIHPPATRLAIIWRYLALGFTHIMPHGLDHILFVLGIYLLSGRARAVLLQVSAFTLAHSITLALSMYGVVAVPPRIVEPLIAASIAYVAIENLFLSELKSWRLALVFGFGLLHGMGFAGALMELGLPRSEYLTALLAFNVGVESGQLAVIAAAFVLVGWQWSNREWYRARVVVPASAMIACVAVYWTINRLSL